MTVIYLIHFGAPLGSEKHKAQHYLGLAQDIEARLAEHRRGGGARITQVAVERGITLTIVRTWSGGRQIERHLKRQHGHPRLCPVCNPQAAKRMARPGRTSGRRD